MMGAEMRPDDNFETGMFILLKLFIKLLLFMEKMYTYCALKLIQNKCLMNIDENEPHFIYLNQFHQFFYLY